MERMYSSIFSRRHPSGLNLSIALIRKNWSSTFIPFVKARKRIETLFSQLTDQFMVIRNYVKITNGLFIRIIGKISALTVSYVKILFAI